MSTRDIVVPRYSDTDPLTSGCEHYADAVVVSVKPFVLVSRASDMRWSCTVKINEFTRTGTANEATMQRVQRRLDS